MYRKLSFLFLLFIFCVVGIFAQDTLQETQIPGENLTIKVAVAGPGDELYFWWGHIALVIEDSETGKSRFYDYGLFSLENEAFYYNFAFGRLLFSCGTSSAERNVSNYRIKNRSLIYYTLDLPPETRLKVKEFAEINVLPENRDYYYHHFRDNCSTRIRDIIDFATDGQFKEHFEAIQGQFTLRQHVRRHTWFSPFPDWFLNFLMGQVIDRPITIWDDMFLPAEVGRRVQEFSYNDINGVTRKLVASPESVEVVLTSKNRPEILEVPRKQWPFTLAFSLVLASIFGFFFYLHSKKIRAGRILAGISISVCGLFFGLASLMLYFLALFTNHDYTYQNINMIFCSPLILSAIPIGIGYASVTDPKKLIFYDLLSRLLWLCTAVGIFISMLIKILPWFYQANLVDEFLMLPISLVFAFQPIGLRAVFDQYFTKKNKKNQKKKRKNGKKRRMA